ncbi:NmrA/HSCARG family protein [Actinokineospora bangkokensis]|uniref:NmrA-like domain-containing protein n=1 Tax=Actinokineospora bangkokensis TaxID=1193682 RepID=A0A1Q9LLU5_9PSEU|nr:NmrA/HSCARG family protein [Actinokineospora bangkokensis]OLR92974.1 hypothetical protein BJP25_18590 [Actinokineospora bangkokensis]
MSTRPHAVIGATGQQGGATARALLAAGAPVRALVRDPQAAKARALAEAGASLVRADLTDRASLREAFEDVAGVFAMTTFATARGPEGEVHDGVTIAEVAAEAGVPHVVHSSVGGAERATGIPHFESKRRIEEAFLREGVPTTFVRPVFFMENLSPSREDGGVVLRLPMPADVPLQVIAVADIGTACAAVALDPARVPGGAVEVGGDELTPARMAQLLGERDGVPGRFEEVPVDGLDEDMRAMFTWFRRLPAYRADFDLTRDLVPDVADFATWARR